MGVALMPKTVLERADRACAGEECETSIGLLEEAVRRRPGDYRLHYRLGLCYGGSCRTHPLVRPGMAVPYLREALRLIGPGPGRLRADILDQLGNTLAEGGSEPREAALRAAIDCHHEAAEIYRDLGRMDDWARLQFNLGNFCCELSETAEEDHWQEAISRYESSLQVRTREKDPERYAAVLENLGTAYRRFPDPHGSDAGRHVKMSIRCYRRALAVYVRSTYPEQHAALQNNLGNAFLSLPETGERMAGRNAARALHHFERALGVQSWNTRGRTFAITQYNCAQAHFRLARFRPAINMKLAAGFLEAAAAAFHACGEDRYTQIARAQLDRICRASA
jgi:tetratricopeptide (TPR) repeat protein